MTTTTADRFPEFDPAQSFELRAFFLLDPIVAKVRARILVELTRLSFLGFFDRFESFLDSVQLAEDEATSEHEVCEILSQKDKLAKSIERLVNSLDSMARVPFRDSSLAVYVAGNSRMEILKAFVASAKLERGIEDQIEQAKLDFLSKFARRKLTRDQRQLLVEKYRKITVGN
jgi:hypothetical protein